MLQFTTSRRESQAGCYDRDPYTTIHSTHMEIFTYLHLP